MELQVIDAQGKSASTVSASDDVFGRAYWVKIYSRHSDHPVALVERAQRGDFPGAGRILRELKEGVPSKRVGIRPLGRAPAREGTEIQNVDGETVGVITSGGFGPTVNGPVAQGYVDTSYAKAGTPLKLIVRGKALEAEVEAAMLRWEELEARSGGK